MFAFGLRNEVLSRLYAMRMEREAKQYLFLFNAIV